MIPYYECETLVEELSQIEIKEYGGKSWIRQHGIISRLNLQAHINAAMRGDEFVMESISTFDKVKTLIYELLVSEAWKDNLLPLLEEDVSKVSTLKGYLVLFQEAVLCNLLETIVYHRTALDAAGEHLVELMDYCYRYVQKLVSGKLEFKDKEYTAKKIQNFDKLEELHIQKSQIEFQCAMSCISIIRYISDHVRTLPVSISSHFMLDNDIIMGLVPLIESRPWLRTKDQKRQKWEDSKWQDIQKNEYGKLPKIEGQVWIAIYNLIMTQETAERYEITDYRKGMLLRVNQYCTYQIVEEIYERYPSRPDSQP